MTQSIGLVEQKNFDVIDIYRRGFEAVLENNPTSFDTIQEARSAGGLPPIEVVCFHELSVEGFDFVGQAEQDFLHLLTPGNRSCLGIWPRYRAAPPLESAEIIRI